MIIGRRTRMVQRYLWGRLAGDDLQGFLRRVERDSKLRKIFEEEQAIQQAMTKDKATVPVLGTEFPQRLQQKLEAHPAPEQGKSGKGGSGIGMSSLDRLASSFNRPLLRVLLTALGILVMLGVSLMIFGTPEFLKHTEPNPSTTISTGKSGDSVGHASNANGSAPKPDLPSVSEHGASGAVSPQGDIHRPSSVSAANTPTTTPDRNAISVDGPGGHSKVDAEKSIRSSLDKEERSGDTPVLTSDSTTRVNVKLKN